MLGARLGFVPGWLCGWLGLVLGNAIGYAIGRLLMARLAPESARLPTLLVLFISRPVPVLAEALTFTAGAEKMNFAAFSAVSVAGNGIYALALAGNGAMLLPDALAGPGLILPLSLPVAAWLLWRWLDRRKTTRTTEN
jgi:membrane protein DedA with SNARE-associated domain